MKSFATLLTSASVAFVLCIGGVAQARDRHQDHRGNNGRHSNHGDRNDSHRDRHHRHHDDDDHRNYRDHRGHGRHYGYNRAHIGLGLYSYPYYRGGYYNNGYYGYRSAPVYRGRVVSSRGDDSIAVEVQTELARRGYYRGEIDGIIGSGTRRALRNFQAEEGLRVTGRLDPATIDELDIG